MKRICYSFRCPCRILVQFEVSARAPFRHGTFLIPVLRGDASAEVHFRDLTAYGNADKNRILDPKFGLTPKIRLDPQYALFYRIGILQKSLKLS